MTRRFRRPARTLGLLAVTGTTLVAAATTAGATTTATNPPAALAFGGTTASGNVSVNLTLPGGSALAGPLGAVFTSAGLPDPFDGDGTLSLTLLNANGSLRHSPTDVVPELDTSEAKTATGTIGDLLTALQSSLDLPLDPSAEATFTTLGTHLSPQLLGTAYDQLPASVQQLLTLAVPGISETSAVGPMMTTGTGRIATADLGSLASALPANLLDPLTSALNEVSAESQTLFGSGGGTLGGVVGQVLGLLPLPAAQVQQLQQEATALQQELSTEIPAALTAIESGSILTVNGLSTTDTLTTTGADEVSTVHNSLAGISVLGGLVKVRGFANGVTTQAGGTKGSATVVATPNAATASVGTDNELTAAVGQAVTLGGTVTDLVNTLTGGLVDQLGLGELGTLTGGLGTLEDDLNAVTAAAGIQIVPDHVVSQSSAADGSSAAAVLSGLQIVVDPLAGLPTTGTLTSGASRSVHAASDTTSTRTAHVATPKAAAAPLLDLDIGAASASSTAHMGATTATTSPSPTATTTSPTGSPTAGSGGGTEPAGSSTTADGTTGTGTLAFTGADLPLTGGVAAALLAAGAWALRRRRLTDRDL